MAIFDDIVKVDNLKKAWVKVYQFARTEEIYFDEYAYDVFNSHLDTRLVELSCDLQEESYTPSNLRYISIPKGEEARKIYFLSPRDSVVIQAVINVIGPIFENNFVDESFGYRLNINVLESKETYTNWLDQYAEYASTVRGFTQFGIDAWYLITDIENYYPSVSKDWLIGLIGSKVDAKTLSLIKQFLELKAIGEKDEVEAVPGIPPGPIYGHFFANIYLDEFDHKAKDYTLGYARYVDDICLICRSKVKLNETREFLSEYLNRWNQNFKGEEKTIQRPIIDVEPLYEHTRKMRYASRLDFVDTQDIDAEAISKVRNAESFLSRICKIAEREGDISHIVEEAGSIIYYLKRAGDPDLLEIIYSLLEAYPVRASTLKSILIYLLEEEREKLSEKFWEFFFGSKPKPAYVSTMFLRLVGYFEIKHTNLSKVIIESYSDDPNYLVRASSHNALRPFIANIGLDSYRNLLNEEASIYVKRRIIDNFALIDNQNVWLSLLPLIRDKELSASLLRCYSVLFETRKLDIGFINSIWGTIKDIELEFNVSIYLLYIASKHCIFWLLKEILGQDPRLKLIFPTLALQVINELSSKSEIIMINLFANEINKLGYKEEAIIGLSEVAGQSKDMDLSLAVNKTIQKIEEKTELPDWMKSDTCMRKNYRGDRNDKDYICLHLEDVDRKGILEIISINRIKGVGFSDVQEWSTYLDELSQKGIIPEIVISKYDETKVACFYEFPDGYSTLAEILEDEDTRQLVTKRPAVQIIRKIVKNINSCTNQFFSIHSIDPQAILWNPLDGKVLIIGINASLTVGKYLCGIPGCPKSEGEKEIGISATILHIGLLFFQLLSLQCPLEIVLPTKSRYAPKKRITDHILDFDILPHFQMLLGRMLSPDAKSRYKDMNTLTSDFEEAYDFSEFLHTEKANKRLDSKSENQWILFDYLLFRFNVISRNPSITSSSQIFRSKRMLEELSNTTKYLQDELLSYWGAGLENPSNIHYFPSARYSNKLSPEGKRLLEIAYGWEKIRGNLNLETNIPSPISQLLLYRTISIEIISTFVSILLVVSEAESKQIREQTLGFCTIINNYIGDQSEAVFFINENGDKRDVMLSKQDLFNLQMLSGWQDSKSININQLPSLRIIGLYVYINSFSNEFYFGSDSVFITKQVVNIKAKDKIKFGWFLLEDLPLLDKLVSKESIMESRSESTDYSPTHTDVWTRYLEIIKYFRDANPSKRRNAEIYSCDYKNFQQDVEGLVDVLSPLTSTLHFDSTECFISGNPRVFDDDLKRPARVDLIKPSQNNPKITSLLAPIGLFVEIPLKQKIFFNISKFLRKRKNVYQVIKTVLTIILFLFTWMFTNYLILQLSGSPNPILGASTSVVVALISRYGMKYLDKKINTLNPGENDLVLRNGN